ncbi:hypothetical protein K8I85_02585 [bacterium]|nr:hypothetical protein [bacterium]
MRLRGFRPRWLPLLAALPALVLGGCDDDRGAPTEPDTGVLDGDVIFGSATISALFFSFLNEIGAVALAVHESPIPVALPLSMPGCSGTGQATLSDNGDSDPTTYRMALGNATIGTPYVTGCETGISLSFVGSLVIRFEETDPGLNYTISMPFHHATGQPQGVTMQLPQGFGGGLILQMTTPYDENPADAFDETAIRFRLNGTRDVLSAGGGTVRVTGTLRLEDRTLPITLVEELSLQYQAALSTDPGTEGLLLFSEWPGGMYEVAGNGVAGPGAAPIPGYPVEVYFDGLGGTAFEFEGHSCEANMVTGENPCEQFN